jgi:hypothetical protein
VDRFRSDQSLQVLVLVVLPLLLLVAAAIFLRIRHTPPTIAKFPQFSVSLSRVGREDAYVVYRDDERRLEFYAGPGDRKQALRLELPEGLPSQDAHEIAQRLATGLTKLRFQKYEILKKGKKATIAGSSREKNDDMS